MAVHLVRKKMRSQGVNYTKGDSFDSTSVDSAVFDRLVRQDYVAAVPTRRLPKPKADVAGETNTAQDADVGSPPEPDPAADAEGAEDNDDGSNPLA